MNLFSSLLSLLSSLLSPLLFILLRLICLFLLSLMGWKVPSTKNLRKKKGRYTVYVFSHTSRMDFFLSILYCLAQPEYGVNSALLLMPGIFNKYTTPILNWLKFIKATHSSEKGKGNNLVASVISYARGKPGFHLALSPEGTLTASPWSGSYFWIAKGLAAIHPKVEVRVTGFDYERKTLHFNNVYTIKKPLEKEDYLSLSKEECFEKYNKERLDVEKKLKVDMGDIVPLYPECSFVPIRKHSPEKISIVRRFHFFFCLFFLFYFLCVPNNFLFYLNLTAIISNICSYSGNLRTFLDDYMEKDGIESLIEITGTTFIFLNVSQVIFYFTYLKLHINFSILIFVLSTMEKETIFYMMILSFLLLYLFNN